MAPEAGRAEFNALQKRVLIPAEAETRTSSKTKVVRQGGEQPGENRQTTEEHEHEQDGPVSGERRIRPWEGSKRLLRMSRHI